MSARTMSTKHLARDICLFQGCHAHMQSRVTGHEAKQWPGVAKAAFPWGFLQPLLPVDHNLSSPRFLAETLTVCVFGHPEKDMYPNTQKGVAIKKIFELRAENRTECSLGW